MPKQVHRTHASETVLLTAKQVSEMFGVSLSWVYMNKSLPSLRVGKYIRFKEDELLAYFKNMSLLGR